MSKSRIEFSGAALKNNVMKQLLCPFDFSAAAVNAAKYAAHLAQDRNRDLVLLYVEQVSAWHGVVPEAPGALPLADDGARGTKEQLQSYAASLEHEFKIRCTADLRTYIATVSDALGKAISLGDFELIVMGTGGADTEMDHLFGTTTYQVIRDARKPLLLVPENCRFEKPSRILYATDYCPDDLSHITGLLTLFARYRPELTVFHVSKKRTAVSDEVFRCFRNVLEDDLNQKRNIRFKRAVGDDVPGILTDVMHDYDLLVLFTRHRNLVSSIFQRRTLRKLSLSPDFPMLVFPYQMDR